MHKKEFRMAMGILSALGAIFLTLPLFWAFLASFKSPATLYTLGLPDKWRFANYVEALGSDRWSLYFINSIVLGISAGLGQSFFGALAGYSLAKFDYPGKNFIFAMVIGTLTFSMEVVFVPLFALVSSLRWIDTYQGLIIPTLIAPFSIFLMRQYILGISDSLIESAKIDGASEPRIFLSIIIPLAKPALAVVFILAFTSTYNGLLWPLIVIRSNSKQTISLALQQFQGAYTYRPDLILAVAMVSILPMIALFFIFQKYFLRGVILSPEK